MPITFEEWHEKTNGKGFTPAQMNALLEFKGAAYGLISEIEDKDFAKDTVDVTRHINNLIMPVSIDSSDERKKSWEESANFLVTYCKSLENAKRFNDIANAGTKLENPLLGHNCIKLGAFVDTVSKQFDSTVDPQSVDRNYDQYLEDKERVYIAGKEAYERENISYEREKEMADKTAQRHDRSERERRYKFTQELFDMRNSGLEAQHRISFIGGGSSIELDNLKDAIDLYTDFYQHPQKPKFKGMSETRLLEIVADKAKTYIDTKRKEGFFNTSDPDWQPKSKMGKKRFNTALSILENTNKRISELKKDELKAKEIKEYSQFINESEKSKIKQDDLDTHEKKLYDEPDFSYKTERYFGAVRQYLGNDPAQTRKNHTKLYTSVIKLDKLLDGLIEISDDPKRIEELTAHKKALYSLRSYSADINGNHTRSSVKNNKDIEGLKNLKNGLLNGKLMEDLYREAMLSSYAEGAGEFMDSLRTVSDAAALGLDFNALEQKVAFLNAPINKNEKANSVGLNIINNLIESNGPDAMDEIVEDIYTMSKNFDTLSDVYRNEPMSLDLKKIALAFSSLGEVLETDNSVDEIINDHGHLEALDKDLMPLESLKEIMLDKDKVTSLMLSSHDLGIEGNEILLGALLMADPEFYEKNMDTIDNNLMSGTQAIENEKRAKARELAEERRKQVLENATKNIKDFKKVNDSIEKKKTYINEELTKLGDLDKEFDELRNDNKDINKERPRYTLSQKESPEFSKAVEADRDMLHTTADKLMQTQQISNKDIKNMKVGISRIIAASVLVKNGDRSFDKDWDQRRNDLAEVIVNDKATISKVMSPAGETDHIYKTAKLIKMADTLNGNGLRQEYMKCKSPEASNNNVNSEHVIRKSTSVHSELGSGSF